MMLCQGHQADLRSVLDAKGLGSLISDDEIELLRRHAREHREGPSIDSFDPLYDATYNVLQNCERVALAHSESIRLILGCHMCHVISRYPNASVYSSWFDAAATAMVGKYRRLVS